MARQEEIMGLRKTLKVMSPSASAITKMSDANVVYAAAKLRLVDMDRYDNLINAKKGTRLPYPNSSSVWTDLPYDMVLKILEKIVHLSGKQPNIALNLVATCKQFRDVFWSPDSLPIWRAIWADLRVKRPHVCDSAPQSLRHTESLREYHRAVGLCSFNGCVRCGAPRIRKVTWEFGVRLCKPCLDQITISNYRLTNDHKIHPSHFGHLRHTVVDMYNPYNRSFSRYYTLKFFLRTDIDRVVKEHYGHNTLDEHMAQREADDKAAKLARELRPKDSIKKMIVQNDNNGYRCIACSGRTFAQYNAVYQHVVAKHNA
jgi:hypothetical protein